MQRMNDIKICPSINKFLALLFFGGLWIRFYSNMHILVSLPILFLFSIIFFTLYMVKFQTDIQEIYFFIALIDLFALVAVIINANHTIADVILLMSWQAFGLLMYEMKTRESLKLVRLLAIVSIILIALKMILIFKEYEWGWMILSTRMGSNSASIFILEFLYLDAFFKISDGKKLRYPLAIIAFAMVFMAGGIVGILTVPLLIMGMYLYKYNNKLHMVTRFLSIIVFLGLCMIYIVLFKTTIIGEAFKFIKQGDASSRFLMWKNYYQLVVGNISGLIWGANISGNDLLMTYRNLHNCFFNWHYFYGLLPFISFVGIILYDLKESVRQKQYLYMVIVLTAIFRSMSDEATYAFMPIWIFIFCDLYSSKKKKFRKKMDFQGGLISGKNCVDKFI